MLPAGDGARALLEVRNADAPFLHLVHPRPTPWSTLLEPVAQEYSLQFVPFADWVTLLERSGQGLDADAEVEAMRRNPALKLLQFFKLSLTTEHTSNAVGVCGLDTSHARRASPTLRDMSPLTGEDTRRWLAYWRRHGHL